MNHRSESDPAAGRSGPLHEWARADGRSPARPLPVHLSTLLQAPDGSAREDAWAAFLRQYSGLLLRTVRRASTGHDEAMDRYAFILEQLRNDEFRRLRAFVADGRGKFTTWLVVVARRLCVDHHRHVFGRPQSEHESGSSESLSHTERRNLVALLAGEFDLDQLEDNRLPGPDAAVAEVERNQALVHALSSLEETDRLLLTLRFEDDRPLAEIGPLVGLRSRFQVHRRLKAVLLQLRRALEARGYTRS